MAIKYKQPVSIQAVIFSASPPAWEYLLLRRQAAYGGFWQSVTGSLEPGETYRQAAVREIFEETGIVCVEEDLIDLQLTQVFEIALLWRAKYAPGVTHNEETCFALAVAKRTIQLDPLEHEAFEWVDYQTALAHLYWESNRRAVKVVESRMALPPALIQP